MTLALLLIVNLSAAVPPGQPNLYTPDNDWASNDNLPYFEWENGPGATSHQLQIATDPNFTTIVYDNSNITDNHDNFKTHSENALPNGTYWWRVAAENGGGENWSEDTWTFRIDTVKPSAPSIVSPENNENMNDNTPNLDWDPVTLDNLGNAEPSLPVLYYVAVSDDPAFPHENENSDGWISDNNLQLTSELADGIWYWRVGAKDNAGNAGDNSSTYSFTIDVSMPSPLVSPINGAITNDNTPAFKWDNKVTVDNYEIWIDNDSTFSLPTIKDNTTDNIYNTSDPNYPSGGLADENWFWKVRAFNLDNSHFSEVWTLLIDTKAPPAPSSSADDGLVTNDNTPTIDWASVTDESYSATGEAAGVKYYEIWVDNDSNFSSTVTKENRSTNSWTPVSQLADDNYSYKVRVWDEAGNVGAFSSVWTFRVDVTSPTISGITESSVSKNSATIEWTTNEPADSVVEYGPTTSYGSSKSDSSLVTSHSITLSSLSENTTYHYRVKSTDAANNTKTSDDQTFTTSALAVPTSSVDTISTYWRMLASITITATASDSDGTVENVTLYYRYRENSDASWGDNLLFGVDTDNSNGWSWTFTADNGDGYYEFYTRATDDDAQTEAAPSTADEDAGFDTVSPTLSSVQINGENTITTSVSVTISIGAQDATSGLDKMRFSNDNQTWADWASFENEKGYNLPLPDGTKMVYVQVKDAAGLTSSVLDNSILLENATFTESVGSIAENENKLADFSDWGLAVKGVRLYAEENITGAEVHLRVLEGKPTEITVEEPGTTAFYFEVKTNAPSGKLAKVEIEFDVARAWLDDRGVKAADVVLWKLNNTWQKVSATITGENTSHVHFSASVASLSWFVVTAEKPAAPAPYWVLGVVAAVVVLILLIWWWRTRPRGGIPGRGL